MDVVYWNRSPRDDGSGVELDELLAGCDVVQVCVALTPDTRHLIDDRRLALMRPRTLLVNTSRGAIVDHRSLAALADGRLAGYATDVWDPEPPTAPFSPAVAERLLVTPHVAAITDVTYRELCVRTAAAAIAALPAAEATARQP